MGVIYNVGLWHTMNHPATRAQYTADLTQYLALMDELNNSLMHPNRRALLETCKHALEIVLEMHEIDNK